MFNSLPEGDASVPLLDGLLDPFQQYEWEVLQ
jgi:hypothetical protein